MPKKWTFQTAAALMLAVPLAVVPQAASQAQEAAAPASVAAELAGRWSGVGLIQDTDVRLPSLIDIEFREAEDGTLVAVDHALPGDTAYPVALDGRDFAFETAITLGSSRVIRAQVEGTLSADGESIAAITRAAGLSGRIEDVRQATLTQGDTVAESAFRHARVDGQGEPVTSYTYRLPVDGTGTFVSVTPEQAGLDRAQLEAMVNSILQQSPMSKTESVLVLREGKLVLAEYFWGNGPEDAHQTWSVVKSITATVAGIAWDNDAFELDRTVTSYFPEQAGSMWARGHYPVSVRQMLSMTSGAHIPNPADLGTAPDVVDFMFSQPLEHAPALHYNYDNGLPVLAAQLVEEVTGVPYDRYAEDHLLRPLGIENVRWTYFADGSPNAAGGFFIRPVDFARIGQMMLDGGTWQGRRIVSEEWVQESTRRQTAAGDYAYGFYWHLNDAEEGPRFLGADAYMAIGALGQLIAVIPDENIVVVVTSTNTEPWELVGDYIVPAIVVSHVPAEAVEVEPAAEAAE